VFFSRFRRKQLIAFVYTSELGLELYLILLVLFVLTRTAPHCPYYYYPTKSSIIC
jgi:hypothetical protein